MGFFYLLSGFFQSARQLCFQSNLQLEATKL